jgi:hypothetical protein
MIIPIKTNRDKILEQYLTLINPILGDKKLTNIEIKVLAKLLEAKAMYSKLGKDLCDRLVFHEDTKRKIREVIGEELKVVYSVSSMNNVISALRKKGIVKGNSIEFAVPIKDDKIELTFVLETKND